MSHAQVPLFNEAPYGFQYRYNFVTPDEETLLIQAVARIAFSTFEMRGVAARRRVAFFGRSYNSARLPAEPLPAFLIPFRDRVTLEPRSAYLMTGESRSAFEHHIPAVTR